MEYKFYADDMVIFCKYENVANIINAFKRVTDEYNLKINPKKSGIMYLHRDKEEINVKSLAEIPIVWSYKYLGITFSNKGDIDDYLNMIERRSNYIIFCTRYFVRELSFENQYLFWMIYIRPYFLYAFPVIDTIPLKQKNRFFILWRKSLK